MLYAVSLFDLQYWRAVHMATPCHLAAVMTTHLAIRWRAFEKWLGEDEARQLQEQRKDSVCSICMDEETQHRAPDVRVACCNTPFHLRCLGE